MALDAQILQRLTQDSPKEAWRIITDRVLEIASKPLAEGNAPSEVVKRDREIAELDLFLASSGWDLWRVFGQPEICGVERTSDRLARWWSEPGYGHSVARAVRILDALSLRELPWLLQGASRCRQPFSCTWHLERQLLPKGRTVLLRAVRVSGHPFPHQTRREWPELYGNGREEHAMPRLQ